MFAKLAFTLALEGAWFSPLFREEFTLMTLLTASEGLNRVKHVVSLYF